MTQSSGDRITGDCIHQSDFERSYSGDFFCRDEHLERSAFSDQAWQALRTSPSGHEAEGGAAMSEDGVGSGNPAMARQRKIKPSAHAMALNRGEDGEGIAGDGVHELLSHSSKPAGCRATQGQGGDFVEVGAHGKKL